LVSGVERWSQGPPDPGHRVTPSEGLSLKCQNVKNVNVKKFGGINRIFLVVKA